MTESRRARAAAAVKKRRKTRAHSAWLCAPTLAPVYRCQSNQWFINRRVNERGGKHQAVYAEADGSYAPDATENRWREREREKRWTVHQWFVWTEREREREAASAREGDSLKHVVAILAIHRFR